MSKKGAAVLAALLVLSMLFAFASCKTTTDPDLTTTTEATSEATEAPTDDVVAPVSETTDPSETSETTEATETTTETATATTDATTTTKPGSDAGAAVTTTTKPAAPTMPSGKKDVVAYLNKCVNQMKADKPGYSYRERTIIDDKKLTSSSKFIDGVAPGIIKMVKGFWSNWTDPSTKEKGGDHNGVWPKVDVNAAWVKSASCKESGGNYIIRITFADERVPTLPTDEKNTTHGKLMKARTKGEIADGAAKLGVDIAKFDALYSGSYVEYTVDKATGAPKKAMCYVSCQADMEAKVLGMTLPVSIPLATEREYTFN